jgi:hypothetical protein
MGRSGMTGRNVVNPFASDSSWNEKVMVGAGGM